MIDLKTWRAAGETFNFSQQPIFTRKGGREGAAPLLLIHGYPTSSWDWNKVWPALGECYALYTLDMLGFGDSAKPRDCAYRIAQQADLIEAWLSSQGLREYHILAHDYGDTVAQELMARDNLRRASKTAGGCRLRIASVALLNGGLFPETHRAALIQKLLLSPLGPLVARFTTKERMAANLRAIFGAQTPPSQEEIDGFWELICQNNGKRALQRLINYMTQRKQNRSRWVGALQQSPVPIKLINGSVDPVSGAHMVERYRELVANADVTALANIGHYPQVEAPQAVVDAYLCFRAAQQRAANGARRQAAPVES
ncbi:haloalkane dehalogenase [Microbulbifer aestuariivivens]|uniref:Haloalkane dehalogenase n=1 Tax=Microbulbifer aestuariivivens TaxID=1908308 RepID=A0ABP9WSC6_9GAMM